MGQRGTSKNQPPQGCLSFKREGYSLKISYEEGIRMAQGEREKVDRGIYSSTECRIRRSCSKGDGCKEEPSDGHSQANEREGQNPTHILVREDVRGESL